jgi:hypothetical protein
MILKDRLFPATLTGLAGGAVMIAMLGTLEGNVLVLIFPAVLGAFLSGLACADLFRRPGPRGLAFAALGAVAATLLGASIAGLGLGLVIGPTIAGAWVAPYAVIHAIVTQPEVLLTWVATMTITCWLFRRKAGLAAPVN